jgi:uncharacterized YigZ family protein
MFGILDTFRTISSPSQGLYKTRGSKFLSFAHPVTTENEVKEIVKAYRLEFYDARHVCFAYVLGAERSKFRCNDDGEPSGTAGRPILGQIHSRGLTNVVVVVVRYFGGTLLGVSGLISAYKESAAIALNGATLLEIMLEEEINIRFNYIHLNEVMHISKDFHASILSHTYDNECVMQLSVRKSDYQLFILKMKAISGLKLLE